MSADAVEIMEVLRNFVRQNARVVQMFEQQLANTGVLFQLWCHVKKILKHADASDDVDVVLLFYKTVEERAKNRGMTWSEDVVTNLKMLDKIFAPVSTAEPATDMSRSDWETYVDACHERYRDIYPTLPGTTQAEVDLALKCNHVIWCDLPMLIKKKLNLPGPDKGADSATLIFDDLDNIVSLELGQAKTGGNAHTCINFPQHLAGLFAVASVCNIPISRCWLYCPPEWNYPSRFCQNVLNSNPNVFAYDKLQIVHPDAGEVTVTTIEQPAAAVEATTPSAFRSWMPWLETNLDKMKNMLSTRKQNSNIIIDNFKNLTDLQDIALRISVTTGLAKTSTFFFICNHVFTEQGQTVRLYVHNREMMHQVKTQLHRYRDLLGDEIFGRFGFGCAQTTAKYQYQCLSFWSSLPFHAIIPMCTIFDEEHKLKTAAKISGLEEASMRQQKILSARKSECVIVMSATPSWNGNLLPDIHISRQAAKVDGYARPDLEMNIVEATAPGKSEAGDREHLLTAAVQQLVQIRNIGVCMVRCSRVEECKNMMERMKACYPDQPGVAKIYCNMTKNNSADNFNKGDVWIPNQSHFGDGVRFVFTVGKGVTGLDSDIISSTLYIGAGCEEIVLEQLIGRSDRWKLSKIVSFYQITDDVESTGKLMGKVVSHFYGRTITDITELARRGILNFEPAITSMSAGPTDIELEEEYRESRRVSFLFTADSSYQEFENEMLRKKFITLKKSSSSSKRKREIEENPEAAADVEEVKNNFPESEMFICEDKKIHWSEMQHTNPIHVMEYLKNYPLNSIVWIKRDVTAEDGTLQRKVHLISSIINTSKQTNTSTLPEWQKVEVFQLQRKQTKMTNTMTVVEPMFNASNKNDSLVEFCEGWGTIPSRKGGTINKLFPDNQKWIQIEKNLAGMVNNSKQGRPSMESTRVLMACRLAPYFENHGIKSAGKTVQELIMLAKKMKSIPNEKENSSARVCHRNVCSSTAQKSFTKDRLVLLNDDDFMEIHVKNCILPNCMLCGEIITWTPAKKTTQLALWNADLEKWHEKQLTAKNAKKQKK